MALFINSSWNEDDWDDSEDWDALSIGSAMKEDLEDDLERLKDDSTIIGSATKEDLGLLKKGKRK